MSATGLEVFDRTLQTTNIWLRDIMERLGPDRQLAWKVLSVVLHKLRDRLPLALSAHFGAELPILVRGVYYDQFEPAKQPTECDLEAFIVEVDEWLADVRPVNARDAVQAVFATISRHMTPGQVTKVKNSLPEDLRNFWNSAEVGVEKPTAQRRAAAG